MDSIHAKRPRSLSILAYLLIAVLLVLIMMNSRTILIPIVIAFGVWLVINDVTDLIHRIKIGGYQMPRSLAMTIGLLIMLFLALRLTGVFAGNINTFMEQLPVYTENLRRLLEQIPHSVWSGLLGLKANRSSDILEQLFALATNYFSAYVSTVAASAASIATNIIYVTIYVIFLLFEQGTFTTKVKNMFSKPDEQQEFQSIIKSIHKQVQTYITVKTGVSLVTGAVSLVIMLLFGLNHAFVWAILIFILNFIPNIGSIIAVIFPVIMGVLQFGSFSIVSSLFVVLTLVQVIVGNFIEPKMMGDQLNISPFVVLISLSVFGAIWGIIGMFLSVPLTVILMIIFSHFDSTRALAVLLSRDGMVHGIEESDLFTKNARQ